MKSLKVLLKGVLLAALASLNISAAVAATEVGQVTEAQGTAFATSAAGTKRALSAGSAIYEGDVIETIADKAAAQEEKAGNGLKITTVDGAKWNLVRSSKLEVKYYQAEDAGARKAGAKYRVHTGSLSYESGSLKSKAQVLLDDTTLTPLGTTMRFETVSGVTLGKVTDGEVSYTNPDGTKGVIKNGQYMLRDSTGKVTVYPNAQAAKSDLMKALQAVAKTQGHGQANAGLVQQTGTEGAMATNWGFASVETFATWMTGEVTNDVVTYTNVASTSGSSATLGTVNGLPTLSVPTGSGGGGGNASPNK